MGLIFGRRRRVGKRSALNVSARGASLSQRRGRVTVSSRGKVSLRLGKGLRWRS